MLPKYSLDSSINVDKITVSAWGNLGANTAAGSSPGFKQPTLRLYDTTNWLLDQKNAFEFWLGGYIIEDASKKNFMMTVILKGGLGPKQRWKSDDDSIPLDRWFYGSTTWDGNTGKQSETVQHNNMF